MLAFEVAGSERKLKWESVSSVSCSLFFNIDDKSNTLLCAAKGKNSEETDEGLKRRVTPTCTTTADKRARVVEDMLSAGEGVELVSGDLHLFPCM